MTTRRQLLELTTALPAMAWGAASPADPLEIPMAKIRRLFKPKSPPRPGDWLAEHREAGQTFREFVAQQRTRASDSFEIIRVVPVGPLSTGEKAVLDITVDFMKPFFGLPVIVDAPVALAEIPTDAQRQLFDEATHQLLTSYLLNDVLKKRRRPKDAAVLGITSVDLWPGPGWNFVFGQASLKERVGVWSMARNGYADGKAAQRTLCALRTVMTATHETGHMFGIRHCIAYECGMNGSNHTEERDRQPLEFCPECQAKLWWTLNLDPLVRSRALEALARRHGFARGASDLAQQSRALSAP
jgi:archaemetzincin